MLLQLRTCRQPCEIRKKPLHTRYTRRCSCVACCQCVAAGKMRASSFSKSCHHACCRIRAKSSSLRKCEAREAVTRPTSTNLCSQQTQRVERMMHLENTVQNLPGIIAAQNLLQRRSVIPNCGGCGSRRSSLGKPAAAARSGRRDPSERKRRQRCMLLPRRRRR